MTPFAELLKRYRKVRKLRQADVADKSNIEQSYLSALENGHKAAPSDRVLNRVCDTLQLNDNEKARLLAYRLLSASSIEIPITTTIEGRELLFALVPKLDRLSEEGIGAMMKMLIALENRQKENAMEN